MRYMKEESCITQQRPRVVEERRSAQGESRANAHVIPHEAVGTLNHQSARWVEGRWTAPANGCEREYAPQGDSRTNGSGNHSRQLMHANRQGVDNSGPC